MNSSIEGIKSFYALRKKRSGRWYVARGFGYRWTSDLSQASLVSSRDGFLLPAAGDEIVHIIATLRAEE